MLGVLRETGDEEASLDTAARHRRHRRCRRPVDRSGRADDAGRSKAGNVHSAPGIELAGFRIVQEALTNVRKHAGGSASATVRIAYGARRLVIEVIDDGRARRRRWRGSGGGHGLIGMRERVEIYGGELSAGPRPGGGYAVRATLPVVDADRKRRLAPGRATDGGDVMTIRVAIVDDQALMRDGFAMILDAQPDIEVVGDAENGRLGVELCQRDTTRRGADGHPHASARRHRGDAADRRAMSSDTKVLVLTTFDLDEYVYAAMRAGASGYLLKDTPAKELVAAVRVIAQGEALLSPSVTKRLIEEFARQPEPETATASLPDDLTDREREALSCWPTASATARSPPRCTSARPPPRPTSAAC